MNVWSLVTVSSYSLCVQIIIASVAERDRSSPVSGVSDLFSEKAIIYL